MLTRLQAMYAWSRTFRASTRTAWSSHSTPTTFSPSRLHARRDESDDVKEAEQSKQIEQEHDDGVITDAQDDEDAADWTDVAEPVTEEDAQSREVLVNETPRHEVAPPAPQQHLRSALGAEANR